MYQAIGACFQSISKVQNYIAELDNTVAVLEIHSLLEGLITSIEFGSAVEGEDTVVDELREYRPITTTTDVELDVGVDMSVAAPKKQGAPTYLPQSLPMSSVDTNLFDYLQERHTPDAKHNEDVMSTPPVFTRIFWLWRLNQQLTSTRFRTQIQIPK